MPDYSRVNDRQLELPVRLPLFGIPDNRDAVPDLDSRMVNAFIEKGPSGQWRVVKRPGLVKVVTKPANTIAGCGIFGGYVIWNVASGATSGARKLYSWSSNGSSSFVGDVDTYSTAEARDAFNTAWMGFTPVGSNLYVLTFNNSVNLGFYYPPSTYRLVPRAGVPINITASITSGSDIVTHNTTPPGRYYAVSGTGIPSGATITEVPDATTFRISAPATATNATAALALTPVAPDETPTANPGFSQPFTATARFVGGFAVLNRSLYAGMINTRIHGADPDAPLDWAPLNYIIPYAEYGNLIYVGRQASHIIAFKSHSTEFFQDQGLTDGSPLARVEGLQLDVGAYNAKCVQTFESAIAFMSNNIKLERSVYVIEGLRAKEIAGPAEKRMLTAANDWRSLSINTVGHQFFLLTSVQAGVTLAFDFVSGLWAYWSGLGESYFPFVGACACEVGDGTLLLHETGDIYRMREDFYTDAGDAIVMDLFPPEFDGGFRQSKYLPKMFFVADQENGSRLRVRVNDFNRDPQKWTNWREVNLASARPMLTDCGSFYKRAFHFRHDLPTPCRLEAVELDLQPGVL